MDLGEINLVGGRRVCVDWYGYRIPYWFLCQKARKRCPAPLSCRREMATGHYIDSTV